MVVEFYNISQFEAIGVLYDECTLSNGYSYVAGCKVRPNTSIMWQDILGQAPSNEAGLKAPYPEVVEDVNSLSSDLLLDNIVVNTNILNDENLNLSNK